MPKLALSYRRQDAPAMAGRIRDKLAGRYGEDTVFMDIDSIPIGMDFREHLNTVLSGIDVLVAIVGQKWAGPKKDGSLRIKDGNDYVRLEIEAALARNIPVIPVLVDGAEMPKEEEVPETLAPFLFRHAAEVDTGIDFHMHMDRLIKSMDRLFAPGPEAAPAPSPPLPAVPPVAVSAPAAMPSPAPNTEAPPKTDRPPSRPTAQPTAAARGRAALPSAQAATMPSPVGGLTPQVWLIVAVGALCLAAVSPLMLALAVPATSPSAVVQFIIALAIGYVLGSRSLAFPTLCVAAVIAGVGDAALTYVYFGLAYGSSTVLPAPILLFILADAAAIVGGERLRRFRSTWNRGNLAAGLASALAGILLFVAAYAVLN